MEKKVICDQIETFTNSTLCKTVSILELALTRVLSLDLINLSRIIIFSITKTHKIYFTFIIIYFVHFSKWIIQSFSEEREEWRGS